MSEPQGIRFRGYPIEQWSRRMAPAEPDSTTRRKVAR